MEENVRERLSPSQPISVYLDENLHNIKVYTNNSSDVIVKPGAVGQNRIAVLMCEGMADTDTLAELVYNKLNTLGNQDPMKPDELMSGLFGEYLTAAEQLELTTLGDLVLKMQSGFAIILVNGCARAIGIGIQGYKTRGIDEPSSELNVRGSREGFVEAVRTNMSMIRRRIKSPTLVFELQQLGSRSNTDICVCYISDKADPKLLENVKNRLNSVELNTILESGYIQPYLEGDGGWFFLNAAPANVRTRSPQSFTRGA